MKIALWTVAALLGCGDNIAPPDASPDAPGNIVFLCKGGGPEKLVCAPPPDLVLDGWDCRPFQMTC